MLRGIFAAAAGRGFSTDSVNPISARLASLTFLFLYLRLWGSTNRSRTPCAQEMPDEASPREGTGSRCQTSPLRAFVCQKASEHF